MTGQIAPEPDPLSGRADSYFARRTLWDWHNGEQIDLLAPDGSPVSTLDDWHTSVFYGADGNRTVRGFLNWWRGHYRDLDTVPSDLDARIGACLSYLADELGAVEFSDRFVELPFYFELPRSEQQWDESQRAMRADGLLPPT